MYLLMIISPNINNVAMSLYDIINVKIQYIQTCVLSVYGPMFWLSHLSSRTFIQAERGPPAVQTDSNHWKPGTYSGGYAAQQLQDIDLEGATVMGVRQRIQLIEMHAAILAHLVRHD